MPKSAAFVTNRNRLTAFSFERPDLMIWTLASGFTTVVQRSTRPLLTDDMDRSVLKNSKTQKIKMIVNWENTHNKVQ